MHFNVTQPLCPGTQIILAVPNVAYIDTQQPVSLSAAKKHVILVQDQSVHRVSLWQHFTSKITLRCEKTLSGLGHLTLVAGGGP